MSISHLTSWNRTWDLGSSTALRDASGHMFLGKQCSGQEVHKDGIGCGLAEDEGSQGDQKDSITDQCPPAVG